MAQIFLSFLKVYLKMIPSKKFTAAASATPKGRSDIPEAIPASTNSQTEKYSVYIQ